MTNTIGTADGDTCNRDGCVGVISYRRAENCSCHISAPCSACTAPRAYCPECEWREWEDPTAHYLDNVTYVTPEGGWVAPRSYVLDASKIDWVAKPHSSCSMIKEGVYPPTASRADVERLVKGTFGGRFESFGNGKFCYIAYTD